MSRPRQPASGSRRRAFGAGGRLRSLGLGLLVAVGLPTGLFPPRAMAQTVRTFSAADLMKGTKVSREACAKLETSVFVEAEGDAVCIRYYIAGDARGKRAAVFFPGDSIGADAKGKIGPDPGYLTQAPEYVQAAVGVWSQRLGVPFIFFGRPGLHGSSGWHGDRRTRREVALTRLALDAIKAREGLAGYHVAGMSGGGILAAAALASRDDVGCAAIASAPLDFHAFAKTFSIPLRTDGPRAHYDLMPEAATVAGRKSARILFLTSPKDRAVPPATQQPFVDAVKAAGGRYLHLFTEGRGPDRHALTEKSLFSLAMCIAGAPDGDIAARYGNTGPDDLPPP